MMADTTKESSYSPLRTLKKLIIYKNILQYTKKSIFLAKAQGAQRAETGMYTFVHEDFEHRATT